MDFKWLIMRELARNTMKTAYVAFFDYTITRSRRLYFLVNVVTTLFLQETGHPEKKIFWVFLYISERHNKNVSCMSKHFEPISFGIAKVCNWAIYEVKGNWLHGQLWALIHTSEMILVCQKSSFMQWVIREEFFSVIFPTAYIHEACLA